MNTFILDVVLLSTYFKDPYDQIYSDITDINQRPLPSDKTREFSITG
ncbi:MAG: hypothetical protein V4598_11560 [Bdellovibrionota bacterium]